MEDIRLQLSHKILKIHKLPLLGCDGHTRAFGVGLLKPDSCIRLTDDEDGLTKLISSCLDSSHALVESKGVSDNLSLEVPARWL